MTELEGRIVAALRPTHGEGGAEGCARVVIGELAAFVRENGTWGVIDLLVEIAGGRCYAADEGNRPRP